MGHRIVKGRVQARVEGKTANGSGEGFVHPRIGYRGDYDIGKTHRHRAGIGTTAALELKLHCIRGYVGRGNDKGDVLPARVKLRVAAIPYAIPRPALTEYTLNLTVSAVPIRAGSGVNIEIHIHLLKVGG